MKRQPCKPLLQYGFTLIELMVAIVIGMLLLAVIASVLVTSEGNRRTLTGVNDVNQAGNYATFMIDQWVRSAGSGFAQTASNGYGCPIAAAKSSSQILPATSSLPAPFASLDTTFRLAPVLIAPDKTTPSVSGKTSDVLIVMEGASGGAEYYMTTQTNPTASDLTLKNTYAYSGNDLLLLVDQLDGSSVRTCAIDQVTSGFTAASSTTSLTLAGTYHSIGSTLTSMSDSVQVTTIGNISNSNPPTFMAIGVGDNNVLYAYDLLQTSSSPLLALAEGVFEMHALYGVDTDADGVINDWVSPSSDTYAYSALTDGSSTATGLLQNIKAIRLGLILRSPLKEKNDDSGNPTTNTPDSITLFSDLDTALQYTRTFTTDEKQFRYRKIDVVIPLRNNLVL